MKKRHGTVLKLLDSTTNKTIKTVTILHYFMWYFSARLILIDNSVTLNFYKYNSFVRSHIYPPLC